MQNQLQFNQSLPPNKDYLKSLEAESIFIFREVAGQFKKPVLLFSGGKDSTVLVFLALKAFYPAPIPFPIMHVDTGHNFEEAIVFRDELVARHGLQLIVRKVADTIKEQGLEEPGGKFPSRNTLQANTLTAAIKEFGFDACIGGGRRDEEKARAKERIFSIRGETGAWQPHNQRPELWDIYNGNYKPGENLRVFPISNWTEADIWQYIKQENIGLPSIYFSHLRKCVVYNGRLLAWSPFIQTDETDRIIETHVRYRTVGDMTCTAAVQSFATTIDEVIAEIESSPISERGETRIDDQISDAGMEDRKMQGYF